MTLNELRTKYGFSSGKYEPNQSCKFCKGTGERRSKDGTLRFCICLFVDHDLSDFVGDSLSGVAKKLREEMEGR